ncbi:hypothetical protein Tco_1154978 [Tanacetum coccineum]
MKESFSDMLHELEEVNPVFMHTTTKVPVPSKDNEYPSWSTSFKTRRTQKTSLALEGFRKNVIYCSIMYKIGTIWTLGGNGEKFGWWFEQDIDGESEDDNEKKLVMVNEEG